MSTQSTSFLCSRPSSRDPSHWGKSQCSSNDLSSPDRRLVISLPTPPTTVRPSPSSFNHTGVCPCCSLTRQTRSGRLHPLLLCLKHFHYLHGSLSASFTTLMVTFSRKPSLSLEILQVCCRPPQ